MKQKMMAPFDFESDFLKNAALSCEERRQWEAFRAAFSALQQRVKQLESRLGALGAAQDKDDDEAASVLSRPDFNREVARMLAFDERYGGASSVLYIDIENLDALAAQKGQNVATKCLHAAANTLARHVRRSDIVGRLSSDEFGVLLPRCDNADAWKKAEAIATALFETLAPLWSETDKPQVSYGAYTFQEKDGVKKGLKQAALDLTKLPVL